MTAPVDTPEAVEAMAARLLDNQFLSREGAAAMLRRLHQRAVDAERERDGANALVERMHSQDVLAIQAWQKAHPGEGPIWPSSIRLSAWCMGEVSNLRAALATARADALREAAGVANAEERRFPDFSLQHAGEIMTARRIAAAILALIPHPTTTGET